MGDFEIAGRQAQARVIAVGNQKGGVGKTTNTVHIARAMVERGRKALIIDLDMNHSATRHFGLAPETFMGAYELLLGEEPPENLVLRKGDEDVELPDGLDLIPANRRLEGVDKALEQKSKFMAPQEVLARPLQTLRKLYDYIFLDTAPNATKPTIAAYLAADYFILSAKPDPFSISGLNDALSDIRDAQQRGNPNLRLLGVVLSAVDRRTTMAKSLSDLVEKSFQTGAGSMKFRTMIGCTAEIPKAQELGRTLFETRPNHPVTDEYRALAAEIEERLVKIEEPTAEVVHG